MTEAKAYPVARMDSIIVKKNRGSKTHLQMPRVRLPIKSKVGERKTAVKVSRQRNNQKEARHFKVSKEVVNKSKHGMEPNQLGGKGGGCEGSCSQCLS